MSSTLDALTSARTPFLIAALPDGTFEWFLPNLDVSDDPEDWAFHALRHGTAETLDDAATAIADASGLLQVVID